MFSDLSSVFSNKLRLWIISLLLSGEKDFAALRRETGATDGNLGRQLEILAQAGFVSVRKSEGLRPRSCYSLTETGEAAFMSYVELLENIVKNAKR